MMAVCGWEPQPHVLNGMKGWMRISQSSTGSAKMLASPLSVSQRLLNHSPDSDWRTQPLVWCGMKLQSMQLPSRLCDLSMPIQGSRVEYCPIERQVRPVHTARLTVWCGNTGKTTRWCHGHQWASETCSWLKQTPQWHGCCRQWTNILVHLPIVKHDRGVFLLVGEGVRYHISYFKDIYA